MDCYVIYNINTRRLFELGAHLMPSAYYCSDRLPPRSFGPGALLGPGALSGHYGNLVVYRSIYSV